MFFGGEKDECPLFLYGTAWKEDDTQRLTELALRQGFRGIDTANQRRHYHEAGVGAALAGAGIPRSELFLQTKFTFRGGQDHRLPYDSAAPVGVQVAQSFASSLEHLGTDYVDSYVLHGPSRRDGLGPLDWEAWRAMEALHDSGQAKRLGISNVAHDQLAELWATARVKPSFVQNRCFAAHGWDRQVRAFCTANGLRYQGFSLLTANRQAFSTPAVVKLAERYRRPIAPLIFRFALQIGMIPLTGTSNAEHMRADLEVTDFEMDAADVQLLEGLFG